MLMISRMMSVGIDWKRDDKNRCLSVEVLAPVTKSRNVLPSPPNLWTQTLSTKADKDKGIHSRANRTMDGFLEWTCSCIELSRWVCQIPWQLDIHPDFCPSAISPFGGSSLLTSVLAGLFMMPWLLRTRSPVSSQWQNSSKSSCHVLGSVSKMSKVAWISYCIVFGVGYCAHDGHI